MNTELVQYCYTIQRQLHKLLIDCNADVVSHRFGVP